MKVGSKVKVSEEELVGAPTSGEGLGGVQKQKQEVQGKRKRSESVLEIVRKERF